MVPYRGIKTVLRARGADSVPAELAPVYDLLQRIRGPAADDDAVSARAFLELAVALYRSRAVLKRVDEDSFPTLWSALVKAEPPLPWYDAATEHLALAAAFQILALANPSDKVPLDEVSFYELSRAEGQPGWPAAARALGLLARGVAFARCDYHYAAQEELAGYLQAVEQVPDAELGLLATPLRRSPQDSREMARAAGHLASAWNHLGMGRDEIATEDAERGLAALERIQVDNEVTQWGWTFVHFRKGRYGEAAASLRKLAASPGLGPEAGAEILASADSLERDKKLPLLHKGRAFLLIGRALVARAGGLEKILAALLGPELGKRAASPALWLEQTQRRLAAMGEDTVAGAAGKARALGQRGLEAIRLRGGTPPDAGEAH